MVLGIVPKMYYFYLLLCVLILNKDARISNSSYLLAIARKQQKNTRSVRASDIIIVINVHKKLG